MYKDKVPQRTNNESPADDMTSQASAGQDNAAQKESKMAEI